MDLSAPPGTFTAGMSSVSWMSHTDQAGEARLEPLARIQSSGGHRRVPTRRQGAFPGGYTLGHRTDPARCRSRLLAQTVDTSRQKRSQRDEIAGVQRNSWVNGRGTARSFLLTAFEANFGGARFRRIARLFRLYAKEVTNRPLKRGRSNFRILRLTPPRRYRQACSPSVGRQKNKGKITSARWRV